VSFKTNIYLVSILLKAVDKLEHDFEEIDYLPQLPIDEDNIAEVNGRTLLIFFKEMQSSHNI
jgi:hypothetical protein